MLTNSKEIKQSPCYSKIMAISISVNLGLIITFSPIINAATANIGAIACTEREQFRQHEKIMKENLGVVTNVILEKMLSTWLETANSCVIFNLKSTPVRVVINEGIINSVCRKTWVKSPEFLALQHKKRPDLIANPPKEWGDTCIEWDEHVTPGPYSKIVIIDGSVNPLLEFWINASQIAE